jgi:glycosyltransferase involved in cell wall biosynthesis
MTDEARLSIGIPTFNRARSVLAQVNALREAELPPWLEIVIIDDASDDGTFELLAEACEGSSMRVVANASNLGYAGNLLRLFDECRAPYLLVSADDDRIMVDSLSALVELLEQRAPDLVSTQYLVDGTLARGRMVTGAIDPTDCFAASAHGPGLIYRRDAARAGIEELRSLLAASSDVALIYPQVVLASRLLQDGTGVWWDRPCVRPGDQLASGLRDAAGERYAGLGARWRQAQGFHDLFSARVADCTDPTSRRRAAAMLAHEEGRLFSFLRFGLAAERPDLLEAFDAGARRFANRRRASYWLGRALRAPRATSTEVMQRFRR